MKSNFIQLPSGIRLHYQEAGQGPLLILLHGFPDFWYGWRHQITALSAHFRVVAPDLRGYNLSDKPRKVSDYRIEALTTDIDQLITALGESDAYLVGHDWGGAVAWATTGFYPKKIKKLAILNMPHPMEMKKALVGFNWAQLKRSWYIFFFQLPWFPERFMQKPGFFKRTYKALLANRKAYSSEEMAEYEKAFANEGAIFGSLAYYRAAFRGVFGAKAMEVPPIQCPVLLLWGEKDQALGKELTIHTKDYCQSSFEVHYDPESGHFIQMDNPEWVNGHLLRYFQEK